MPGNCHSPADLTTTMKHLAPLLLISVLVSLTNAYCFFKILNDVLEKGNHTYCQDDVDGTWHEFESKWRNSACMDCTCTSCCTGYSTPKLFPEDCVSVFDPVECKYIVHKKDNPSELCPIFAAVGK